MYFTCGSVICNLVKDLVLESVKLQKLSPQAAWMSFSCGQCVFRLLLLRLFFFHFMSFKLIYFFLYCYY